MSNILSAILSAIVVGIFLMTLHVFYGLESTTNLIQHCHDLGYKGGEVDDCVIMLEGGVSNEIR